MKTHIDTAPEAIRRNFLNYLHGNRSMAAGYLQALDYAKACHYDCDPYRPVYGVIAERLRATEDARTFRTFVNSHADELALEQKADAEHRKLAEWRKGPDAATVAAANRALYESEQLAQAITARAAELLRQRELTAREQAVADARRELER